MEKESKADRRARILILYRKLIPYFVVLFVASLTVSLWNYHAIRNSIAPDHLLPLVKIISGTQECVPVAFQWTAYLTGISIMSTSLTGGALIGFCASQILGRFFYEDISTTDTPPN